MNWRGLGIFCGLWMGFHWLMACHGYGNVLPRCRSVLDLAQPLPLQWAYQIEQSDVYSWSIWPALALVVGFGGFFGRAGALVSLGVAALTTVPAYLPWIGLNSALAQLNSQLGVATKVELKDLLLLDQARDDLAVRLDLANGAYVIQNNGAKRHTVGSVRWLPSDGSKFTSTENPGVIPPLKFFTGKVKAELKDPKSRPSSARCILSVTDEDLPALPISLEVHF